MATRARRPAAPRKATPLSEARDPCTPQPRLLELARSVHYNVRRAVAGNPNAPAEALCELCSHFLRDVTSNPGWVLATLADPLLLEATEVPLARSSIDLAELTRLARSPRRETQRAVADNARTPAAALALLARSDDGRLLWSVARHPSTTADTLAAIAASRHCDGSTLDALLRHPTTPAGTLRDLISRQPVSRREGAYGDLLTNPAAPAELLVEAMAFPSHRRAVAAHARTPAAVLRGLAHDPDTALRRGVASNPSAPPDLLDELAQDRSADVRLEVAQNRACSTSTLSLLAHDRDAQVRRAVSIHPGTPLYLRQQLGGTR